MNNIKRASLDATFHAESNEHIFKDIRLKKSNKKTKYFEKFTIFIESWKIKFSFKISYDSKR